jgi:dihydroorotase
MKIVIRSGRIIDPSQGIDAVGDLVIENGKIEEVKMQKSKGRGQGPEKYKGAKEIDAAGKLVLPGLVDLHVHLREPGFEYKETIRTGTAAAVRGGITTVCCMPNTNPVNDNASVTEFILKKAASEGSCRVYPIGAITKGQKGEELAEMSIMCEAGCVAFSDDGRPVMDSLMMRRALEYSKVMQVPLISHCEDLSLSAGGVMNEGLLSVMLGLKGIPAQAEEIMVARDIALAELTGGRLHIAHISTEGSVALVRAAKKRGIADVTAETCPHYFSATEEEVGNYRTEAKVNPPLRKKGDVEAIKQGLRDGTIDVIATDHAPHHRDEKLGEFDLAPSGISGLETSLGLSMKLVDEGVLTLAQLIEKMAFMPAKIMGLTKRGIGMIKSGGNADLAIIATKKKYKVNAENFISKGKNTPFDGWILAARPVVTICLERIYEWE